MSLNHIQLPAQLLEDFYQHSLVDDVASAVPQKKTVRFLGKNKKNILILVAHADAAFLPETELEFLTTVLSACQLTLDDVALVNWSSLTQPGTEVMEQIQPRKILFLDVGPELLGFDQPETMYTVVTQKEMEYVNAPGLTLIAETKKTKSLLWAALKKLFCL